MAVPEVTVVIARFLFSGNIYVLYNKPRRQSAVISPDRSTLKFASCVKRIIVGTQRNSFGHVHHFVI